MSKERITCKKYCIKWNDIDRDCEIYGEHHPCPRNCPEFFNYVFEENKKLRKQLKIATEDLFVICNNPSPTFNRVLYARNSLAAIRKVK